MSYRGPSERPLAPLQPSHVKPPASSDTQSTATPQKQKRVACKECRQAKLRCDSLANGTGSPCARCRRLSLDCQIDTSYKRVSKRLKINELAEEVERLRSAVDRRTNDTLTNSGPGGSSNSASNNAQQPQSFQIKPPLFPQLPITSPPSQTLLNRYVSSTPASVSASSAASQSQSLEHINLDKERINDLFRIFFKHYHPFFEILDATVSPDEYYSRSPLLFWAIVAIAARQYQHDATLFSELTPCVSKMIWAAIPALPHTRFIVQAILLLSVWPFPTNSMSTDPSFILVSIAKSAAMQLGLHRPEIISDFMRVKTKLSSEEFQDAVKTWVGSFIASQSVTASIGQSTVIHADWVIEAACETESKYTIPQDLRHHLLISKFITRINSLMAEDKRSETGYPLDRDICVLMNVLEQDFIDLEIRIGKNLSDIHQILLFMSSLQLRTYYFFVLDNDTRREGLLKAYTTALTIMSKIAEADEKSEFIKYAPISYGPFLVIAAMLVMKVAHSSYSRYIDTEGGKRAFDSIIFMFRRASIESNDIRGRISKILTNLWTFHQSCATRLMQEEPKLNIKTRLGASLLHDSLWTWREQFGGQREAFRAAPLDASRNGNLAISEPLPTSLDNVGTTAQSNVDSQMLSQENFNSAFPGLDETNVTFDVQDMDWLWDVGFPSFLPMEYGSYQQSSPGW